jgi:acyl-CoA synthetase (NDP forming)
MGLNGCAIIAINLRVVADCGVRLANDLSVSNCMDKGEIIAVKIVEELRPIFNAKSVAVIGGSSNINKWGGRMVQRLLIAEYQGNIYPINISEDNVQGLHTYRSVLDVPDAIDLAVIAIPAKSVPKTVRECIRKGIKGIVIVSADFAETGSYGRALQEEITNIARQGGVRIIGPNCQGIWNSSNNLNLALSNVPLKGSVSIISGSGNFSHIFSDFCVERGYGLSKVISMGNQADLDVADYLEFLADDPDTEAIFLYLEGFHDGRKLFQTAREATKKKPIVVFKSAKNPSVARVAMSHTAAIAGEDRIFDSMCKQTGLIRSDDMFTSLSMAAVLTKQPPAKGNRIAIMGMGGQGVTTSDICISLGMDVPQITEEDRKFILEGIDFPPQAPPLTNPVDFAGSSLGGLGEAKVLNRLAQLDYIDGIITNIPFLHHNDTDSPAELERMVAKFVEALTEIPQKFGKSLVLQLLPGAARDKEVQRMLADAGIIGFPSPEESVKAMYALVKYGEIKR